MKKLALSLMTALVACIGLSIAYYLLTSDGRLPRFIGGFFTASIFLAWAKSIIGIRFPWEKCHCCGLKMRDHFESPVERERRARKHLDEHLIAQKEK